jgi:hypothetical protein
MSYLEKIVNPLTGRKVNIHSKLGKTIIYNYQQQGGNVSLATSLKKANTLVFCHGNKNNRRMGAGKYEWTCDLDVTQEDCMRSLQDQDGLFEIFKRNLEGNIRYLTFDYSSASDPDNIIDITNVGQLSKLWKDIYRLDAPIKNIVILNCGGFKFSELLPLLVQSKLLLDQIRDKGGVEKIKWNWNIIVPNLISLVNKDMAHMIDILTDDGERINNSVPNIDLLGSVNKTPEMMEKQLLIRDVTEIQDILPYVENVPRELFKGLLDKHLNSKSCLVRETDNHFTRKYLKQRMKILPNSKVSYMSQRDILYGFFWELYKFLIHTGKGHNYYTQKASDNFQTSLDGILYGLGYPQDEIININSIIYTPGKTWTTIKEGRRRGELRGPYIGVTFSSSI